MASTLLVCWPFRLRFWSITQDEPALEAALTFILGQTVSGLPHCYGFLTRQVLVYIAVPTAIYPVTGVCAHVVSFGKDRLAESLDYPILVGATRYRRKCWACHCYWGSWGQARSGFNGNNPWVNSFARKVNSIQGLARCALLWRLLRLFPVLALCHCNGFHYPLPIFFRLAFVGFA